MNDDSQQDGPNSKGVAFLLWLACFCGFFGIHRFYLGRWGSGLLYFFTFGLFGVGQLVDLIRLPGMVTEENMKHAAFRALAEKHALQGGHVRQLSAHAQLGNAGLLPVGSVTTDAETSDALRMQLVQAAAKHGGHLSVTQGVMATGKSFQQIEDTLDDMVKSGYVSIDNDENTGIVIYRFGQLELA
jgi:TM2 domain-containing membrane protein YozV